MTTVAVSARERVLRAATELFQAEGVRAVGVDTIVERAGVAKMTLYKHFPSKEVLVEAFLETCDQQWREALARRVEELSPNPATRPLAVFDALEEWFRQPDFRGCPSINTAMETPASVSGVRRGCRRHKEAIRRMMVGWCAEAGLAAPKREAVADQLLLLYEGAVVSAVIWGGSESARRAKGAAEVLLAAGRK